MTHESSEQVVNPWARRLISRQPHVFLGRGVFFAHRDFNECFLLKMVDVLRCVTLNKITVTFGFTGEDITAKYSFPSVQEDILLKYLTFFLEDDAELEHIKKEYGAVEM
ncbi:hypothetical protein F2Q70_00036545 [Brassica cretica]|uniref:Uncharacterized protein n=1 Tax=Brassica cretica TaxID=69181 RepID=A0A8S9JWW1_BRACR|nr:hypothetical protein F2Q68_00031748 [Brassica cretica]KAF2586309.1 hypothetical protein F2Q70_00036545 [Brassica cretica]